MKGLGVKDSNDQNNKVQQAKPATATNASNVNSDAPHKTDSEPTRTEKQPYSGKFVTPTATNTHHPSSVPNMLGKLPLVGGLLGGTGGL